MRNIIDELQKKHNNGQSWVHCYRYFKKQRKKRKVEKDQCALYLGFYLASFGMYRGSAIIRKYNYTKLKGIFDIIFDTSYEKLWDLNLNITNNEKRDVLDLIFGESKGIYPKLKKRIADILKDDKQATYTPSDTLISKILMGTMCCTPGYDTYFVEGLKRYEEKYKLGNGHFGRSLYKRGFEPLLDFLANNNGYETEAFNKFKGFINSSVTDDYPPMRVLDLFFWIIGYNNQKDREKDDKYKDPNNPSKLFPYSSNR
jgi:hypothetical protein